MVYLEEHITHDVHLLLRCLYNSISDDEIGEQVCGGVSMHTRAPSLLSLAGLLLQACQL